MTGIVRNYINQLAGNPRKIFLIDSLGAILTVFFLFVVLRNFYEYFGMPQTVLTYLSIIVAFLCSFSAICFLFLKAYWTPFIIATSIANSLYCILTMALLFIYYPLLSPIGISYFLIEIAIICGLIYLELQVATTIRREAMK